MLLGKITSIIKTDKELNLFHDFAAEGVHLCPQEKEGTSSSFGHSEMYTLVTFTDRQEMYTLAKFTDRQEAK